MRWVLLSPARPPNSRSPGVASTGCSSVRAHFRPKNSTVPPVRGNPPSVGGLARWGNPGSLRRHQGPLGDLPSLPGPCARRGRSSSGGGHCSAVISRRRDPQHPPLVVARGRGDAPARAKVNSRTRQGPVRGVDRSCRLRGAGPARCRTARRSKRGGGGAVRRRRGRWRGRGRSRQGSAGWARGRGRSRQGSTRPPAGPWPRIANRAPPSPAKKSGTTGSGPRRTVTRHPRPRSASATSSRTTWSRSAKIRGEVLGRPRRRWWYAGSRRGETGHEDKRSSCPMGATPSLCVSPHAGTRPADRIGARHSAPRVGIAAGNRSLAATTRFYGGWACGGPQALDRGGIAFSAVVQGWAFGQRSPPGRRSGSAGAGDPPGAGPSHGVAPAAGGRRRDLEHIRRVRAAARCPFRSDGRP